MLETKPPALPASFMRAIGVSRLTEDERHQKAAQAAREGERRFFAAVTDQLGALLDNCGIDWDATKNPPTAIGTEAPRHYDDFIVTLGDWQFTLTNPDYSPSVYLRFRRADAYEDWSERFQTQAQFGDALRRRLGMAPPLAEDVDDL